MTVCNCTGGYGLCHCKQMSPTIPAPYSTYPIHPAGCICPPGSEQTCRNSHCGRKAPQPLRIT